MTAHFGIRHKIICGVIHVENTCALPFFRQMKRTLALRQIRGKDKSSKKRNELRFEDHITIHMFEPPAAVEREGLYICCHMLSFVSIYLRLSQYGHEANNAFEQAHFKNVVKPMFSGSKRTGFS